jgi:hypothetical protein
MDTYEPEIIQITTPIIRTKTDNVAKTIICFPSVHSLDTVSVSDLAYSLTINELILLCCSVIPE